MYGYGMMPPYGGFPQPQGFPPNGQFFGGAGNNGQFVHAGRPRTAPSFPAAPSGTGQSSSPSKPQAAAVRARTPTSAGQPKYVNTLQQGSQAGQPGAVAGGGQPTTGSPNAGHPSSNHARSVPLQRGGALAPQQQTQATPSGMIQNSQGGRRNWPLEIWVVRHGETIENNTRVIAGQNASGLTEHGQEQANLLSERLQDVEFAGIYISDLNRTKQTADAVLRRLGPGIPAFTDSRLREKGAGQYEGYKIGYIEHMTRLSGHSHRVFRPPGGESWEDVAHRSRSFMREILHRYCICSDMNGRPLSHRGYDSSGRATPVVMDKNAAPLEPKRVLIVTHGGFISEFLSSAVGGVPNCAKNCSIFVLACARDHPRARTQFFLKTINEVAHLEPLLAKGMVQSGPEAVTETAANPKSIEDDEDDDKPQDDVQSNSSTVRTGTPNSMASQSAKSSEQTSPMNGTSKIQSPGYVPMAVPSSPASQHLSPPPAISSLEVPMSMAEIEQREAQARAAAMERMRTMTLETPSDQQMSREQSSTPRRTPVSAGAVSQVPSIHHLNASVPDASKRPAFVKEPSSFSPQYYLDGIPVPPKLTGKNYDLPSYM